MGSLRSKLIQLLRGAYADRTGFEEVYDRLVYEIGLKRKELEEKQGTIVLRSSLSGAAEYKASKELATALSKTYRHNRLAQEAVRRHGGIVVKFVNDGLMVTFPFKGSDSAVQALCAAVEIQKSFVMVNKAIPNEADRIKSQIGIAAGFVIDFSSFSPIGEAITDPQGPVVDMAERLVSITKPSQILTHDTFVNALPGKQDEIAISEPVARRLRGFLQPISVYEVIWDSRPRGISFSPPVFIESGYLTTEFIIDQIRHAKSHVLITGQTNRRFTDDFDFRNLVAEKIEEIPDFILEIVFQNPYSPFKEYAQQETRRRVQDMESLVLENIRKGSRLFRNLVPNVKFFVSDYSMIIPFVKRDSEVFFALPIRSHPEGKKVVGMTGGPYFWTLAESPVARDILLNHLEQQDRVELDLLAIVGDPTTLPNILRAQSTLPDIVTDAS